MTDSPPCSWCAGTGYVGVRLCLACRGSGREADHERLCDGCGVNRADGLCKECDYIDVYET